MTNTPTPPDDLEAEVRGLLACWRTVPCLPTDGDLQCVKCQMRAPVLAALRKQRERITLLEGAMKADDERLRLAAMRAGVVFMGCDTAEHLADVLAEAKAEVATWEDEHKDSSCCACRFESDGERVGECEFHKAQRLRLAHLQAALAKVREALAFYADDENWEEGGYESNGPQGWVSQASSVQLDAGDTAREALAATGGKESDA